MYKIIWIEILAITSTINSQLEDFFLEITRKFQSKLFSININIDVSFFIDLIFLYNNFGQFNHSFIYNNFFTPEFNGLLSICLVRGLLDAGLVRGLLDAGLVRGLLDAG